MDWMQLLILALFFLFPLIQQGVEAARRSREREMPGAEGADEGAWEDEEATWGGDEPRGAPQRQTPPARLDRREENEGEWSSGWLPWPDPEPEPELEPEPEWKRPARALPESRSARPLPESRSAEAEPSFTPSAPPVKPAPPPQPAASPLEPVRLDARPRGPRESARQARSRRDQVDPRLPTGDGPVVETLGAGSPAPIHVSAPRGGTATTPFANALSSRRALRRAVLLHEVLGPPLALRPPSDRPA